MSCAPILDRWYHRIGRARLWSSPIILKVDMNHAIPIVAPSLPMLLTVVPERRTDVSESHSSVLARGCTSWELECCRRGQHGFYIGQGVIYFL